MDEDAKSQFWLCKKPKRIIQNQTVIILMAIFGGMGSTPITILLFYLFKVFPIVVPTILVAWAVSSVIYVIGKTYVWMEERKPRSS